MMRTSDENSTRGHSSSPEQPQLHFRSSSSPIMDDDDECTRSPITENERAQIWAALSKETSKTSSTHGVPLTRKSATGGSGSGGENDPITGCTANNNKQRRDSKTKRFGEALKRLFMNDQTPVARTHHRRDSWDDIYRNKDAAKIRPIHEEYGIL